MESPQDLLDRLLDSVDEVIIYTGWDMEKENNQERLRYYDSCVEFGNRVFFSREDFIDFVIQENDYTEEEAIEYCDSQNWFSAIVVYA